MASGKGAVFANDVLLLFLNATAIANIAQNNATTPATVLVFSLHAAGLTAAGNQSTNEVAYTSYARRFTNARSSATFVVSGAIATLQANIDFPTATGGTATAHSASIGGDPSPLGSGSASTNVGTANKIWYWGDLSADISITNGVTPRIVQTTSTITEA